MISPPPASPADDLLAATLVDAGHVARVALERVFAPATVQLPDIHVGAVTEAMPPAAFKVGLDLEGPFVARLVISSTTADGSRLADALLLRAGSGGAPDEHARAALMEMANIIASSFLSRLASIARARLVPSVPALQPSDSSTDEAREEGWVVVARYEIGLPDGIAELRLHAATDEQFLATLREALTRRG